MVIKKTKQNQTNLNQLFYEKQITKEATSSIVLSYWKFYVCSNLELMC